MKDELAKLGQSLKKDSKESSINTRRVAANFPQIERKLDIVSNSYNFKMDLPVTDTSTKMSLNIYVRPDNCCDCDVGASMGTRRVTGDVTQFIDIDGNAFIPNQPADSPYNGVEYRGVVTSITTIGTLDSIWFAWPGYPFFYPNSAYEEDFNTNAFGDFLLSPTQSIQVPVDGVYNITYHGHASGSTTDTSKITVTLKTKLAETGIWETISKEIMYTIYETLEPNALMIAKDLKISAICYGLSAGDEVAVWVKGENITNLDYSAGTIELTLMGQGYGIVTGYVYHDAPNLNPIEGATVQILLPGMAPVTTDADGKYTITGIIPGVHTIQAAYSTFSASQKVTVERNKVTTDVNFTL